MITKENPKIKEHPEQQTHDSLYIMEVVKTIKNIVIEEYIYSKTKRNPQFTNTKSPTEHSEQQTKNSQDDHININTSVNIFI